MFCGALRLLSMGMLLSSFLLPVHADVCVRTPTDNRALFSQDNEGFFMYVDRIKDGVNIKPWSAGSYGLVRTVVETPQGAVCVKFHEGIDVKPLKRDEKGVPLDVVRPVAPGKVVHVSDQAGRSSYGRYVVLCHETKDGPLYSLYAHLASVGVQVGQKVGTGNALGILGYSGTGLNKTRAHVHLELGLMINDKFTQWYDGNIKTPNHHGNFNGLNLVGFDPAPLLILCNEGKRPTLSEFFSTMEPEYIVRLPGAGMPYIGKTYPFLLKSGKVSATEALSWDITFSSTGVPLALSPRAESPNEPELVWLREDSLNPLYRTCYRVKSIGNGRYDLSGSGKRYALLFGFGRDVTPDSSKT